MHSDKHFLFIGNGPYLNRGCEAIVRGTMEILRREFGQDIHVTNACLVTSSQLAWQVARESDSAISHLQLPVSSPRWSLAWIRRKAYRCVPLPALSHYSALQNPLASAIVAMEVGGDHYSLDYGLPERFLELDRYIWRAGVPVVLWGASVGPFDFIPGFCAAILSHLRQMAGMTIRESASLEYLRKHGLSEAVYSVADPAFAMSAVPPKNSALGFTIPEGAIGLNLSPLMAEYVTAGDMNAWLSKCVEITGSLASATGRTVVLIPHVTSLDRGKGDHWLLRQVMERISGGTAGQVYCVGDNLSAAETKWVISRCELFAGARTHSTIAAMSSAVPTLSFAYSIKARGLNQDIFGSQEFCLGGHELATSIIVNKAKLMLNRCDQIRAHLQTVLPDIIGRAYAAGPILRRIIESRQAAVV